MSYMSCSISKAKYSHVKCFTRKYYALRFSARETSNLHQV